MLRVGLTGGIGSGKSEVARRLEARGALVIDADVIAREVVAEGSAGLAAVATEFGKTILRPDGSLDREMLGSIVFADDARRQALNAIVHPRIAERTQELFAEAPDDAIVVHDVPLLTENGLAPLYDIVIVVDVPEEIQVRRLTTQRGMAQDEAKARITAQATRDERLAIADVIIDNAGSLEQLDAQLDQLWRTQLSASNAE